MSRARLKKVLSFLMILILLFVSVCIPCLATRGENKKLRFMSRKTFFKVEREDQFGRWLRFDSKEKKRIFVEIYNEMKRASGLEKKTKNVSCDFYVDDLLGTWLFLESKKGHTVYSGEELTYLSSVIENIAKNNDILLAI